LVSTMSATTVQRLLTIVGTCAGLAAISYTGRPSGPLVQTEDRSAAPVMPAEGPSVVVAELFTSEGCSSCPPADDVLSQLSASPVGRTTVVTLGEHVDYWDHLGWRDSFSSPAFSNRQSEYETRVFHTGGIYTPQLVIDGSYQVVGSDVRAVRQAIANAARRIKAPIELHAALEQPAQLRLRVRVRVSPDVPLHGEADLVIAVTEDGLGNDVRSGENRGRRLMHSSVVRSLTAAGTITPGAPTLETTTTLPLGSSWIAAKLEIVGLLQERQNRRIVGAGVTRPLIAPAPPTGGGKSS